MQSETPMCYITYAVPAHMMPKLSFGEMPLPVNTEPAPMEEAAIYPPGFMPDWFLNGSFPEDDFDD